MLGWGGRKEYCKLERVQRYIEQGEFLCMANRCVAIVTEII